MLVVFHFRFRIFIAPYLIAAVIVFIAGMAVKMAVKGSFIDCTIDVKSSNSLFTCRCFDISCISERRKIPNHTKNVGLTSSDEYLGKTGRQITSVLSSMDEDI